MVLPHRTPPAPSPRAGPGGGGVASWCGVRSSCWRVAVGGLGLVVRCRGGLGLLVRCLRGSGFAGALPQGVSSCWCAASTFAGGGLRKASTGRLAAALVWGLGPWPAWDAGICVRAWDSEASALATGSRHQRRSIRPSTHEGRIVGALGVGGSASPFAWHGPREGRTSATSGPAQRWIRHLYSAQKVADPPPTTIQWQTHRSTLNTNPQPETPDQRRSRPVEALAERRSTRSRADAAAGRARSRVHAAAAPHPSAQYSSTLEVGPETISSSPVVTKVSAWA